MTLDTHWGGGREKGRAVSRRRQLLRFWCNASETKKERTSKRNYTLFSSLMRSGSLAGPANYTVLSGTLSHSPSLSQHVISLLHLSLPAYMLLFYLLLICMTEGEKA